MADDITGEAESTGAPDKKPGRKLFGRGKAPKEKAPKEKVVKAKKAPKEKAPKKEKAAKKPSRRTPKEPVEKVVRASTDPHSPPSLYTVMLAMSAVFLLLACLLMWYALQQYGPDLWDTSRMTTG